MKKSIELLFFGASWNSRIVALLFFVIQGRALIGILSVNQKTKIHILFLKIPIPWKPKKIDLFEFVLFDFVMWRKWKQ